MVPDNYVLPLIENRLKQTDCKLNGWILDGFPQSESQIMMLKSLKINPSLVCVFEQSEDVSIHRIQHRRIDPETGTVYNMFTNPPPTEDFAIMKRLVQLQEDKDTVVRSRFEAWNSSSPRIIDAYKNVLLNVLTTENSIEQITEMITDAIQNPIS